MELLDPRLAAIGVGAALVGSERVRKTVGRGVGYAASGVATVGAPVIRPVVDAGRDIVGEARTTASRDGTARERTTRERTTRERTTRSRSRSPRTAAARNSRRSDRP